MPYTIQQLASLAGVTTRTLHYYDEINLLKPSRVKSNGYRQYEEQELLRLQQIMFFRELEFPLEKIKTILDSPRFNMATALQQHREQIKRRKKRLNELITTIDKTLKKINHEKNMTDDELYGGFTKEQAESYAEEAKQRWGDTDAYKQSMGKYEKLTREQKLQMQKDADLFMKTIVATMDKGPTSPQMQKLIAEHYNSLRFFYEPNLELYRNLATMYVADKRFAAYFEKYHPDLPVFMRDAIYAYCDAQAGV